MKIVNVSNNEITLLFKENVSIRLIPGSFVFSKDSSLTPSVRVYQKKGFIEVISNTDIPTNLDWNVVYYPLLKTNIEKMLKEVVSNENEEVKEEVKDDIIVPKITKKKSHHKKKIGRPKKRGPKKGTKKTK